MKVLMVEPFVPPYMAEIDGSLESMQQAVGGFIEPAYFYDDVIIVCNDEGKINGSLPNRAIKDENGETIDIIFGTFLSARMVEKISKVFRRIKQESMQICFPTEKQEKIR